MSKKKKRKTKSYEFDPEIGRAIEKQAQKQQEIENKRKKRTLIFWGGAIFGVVVIAAISVIFLLALGLMEW
jgi:cobalamin biosynthesis protein CobD/CbiB